MKTLIINIICLCWGISICGQKPQATTFEKMVAKADNMMKQGKTTDAIKHYNVARILAGADKIRFSINELSLFLMLLKSKKKKLLKVSKKLK